ncbi:composite domain of metallo-dependent hydrolase [Backusella circina FSU 941]|nr:composite domain of metallo-dependent hydrolase [Backusella circina FSU 941]
MSIHSRRGYDSTSAEEQPLVGSPSEQDPSLMNRLKSFDYKNYLKQNRYIAVCITLTAVLLLIVFGLAIFLPEDIKDTFPVSSTPIKSPIAPGISNSALQQGLAKCHALSKLDPVTKPDQNRSFNPRASNNGTAKPILLKNAIVWDGQGDILNNVDVLMENGVIRQVKQGIQAPSGAKIIDVGGHIVSPGLVDMHTHLGVASWPLLAGTSDTNEYGQPLTPFVRSLDAFNPSDKALRIVASGGITTALVLPGSGNMMGGEAFAFKLRPVPTLSNEDMLVQYGIDDNKEKKWRWMKMACGENPKNNYGKQNRMPSTRLGEAYLFRQAFADTRKLIDSQDDWCSAAKAIESNSDTRLLTHYPEDLELETLTGLLRGNVKLNVHCYETHDIEAMVRHSNEFNFSISAFHHAMEAYKIPAILRRARNNVTIATFADHWGYKKEAFGSSPEAPKILYEAGIPVALKSDHPVLNSQHMAFEAAKASHYGLPPQEAFKAITSVPAHALGLGHRVGSLKVGYDADVVIWDRSPLEIGAAPLQVFIDGIALFDEKPIEPVEEIKQKTQVKTTKKMMPKEGAKKIRLTNMGGVFLKGHGSDTAPKSLVADNGVIFAQDIDAQGNADMETIDIQGGYVLPGLIAVGSKLGLVEIPSEDSTGDGIVPSFVSYDPKSIVNAVDGLKLGTTKLKEAYKGGVLTTISTPISKNVVVGTSVAFKTSAESVLNEGAVLSSAAALHFQIGSSAKSSSFPTISSQIAFIRQIFIDNIDKKNTYGEAARGDIPLIISVNNKDEIASLIHLKETIIPNARMAIMGGAEAHLVAPHLAKNKIAVILRPHLCTPENFDSIHCLTGAPLTNGTAAHTLHQYGVKIGVGVLNDGWARNLAWDAGWLAATSPVKSGGKYISESEAIRFVTSNLQEIFGLRDEEDNYLQKRSTDENFVVWSGSPLDIQSRPLFVYTKKEGVVYL